MTDKKLANYLKSVGFETQITSAGVLVTLKNRSVCKMEVQFALDSKYGMDKFNYRRSGTGTIVTSK